MNGLEKIPTAKNLVLAYNELQGKKLSLQTLLTYFQWARFDPRLAEIITAKVISDWKQINPFELNLKLRTTTWPRTLAVILDMAALGIKPQDRLNFKIWKTCATSNLQSGPDEVFFIGVFSFAGKQMKLASERSHHIFRKWNYLGQDVFLNKVQSLKIEKTLIDKNRRREILKNLLTTKTLISVNDYLYALESPVSKRVAQLDLKKFPGIKTTGRTKNRRYHL